MSAWVPDKAHFDVLVRSALEVNSHQLRFRWMANDSDGGVRHRSLQVVPQGPGIVLFGVPHQQDDVSPDELGSILLDECVRSVRCRYQEEGFDLPGDAELVKAGYGYSDPGFKPAAGEVFNAIDCLAYQSCEHPEWNGSEAQTILERLRHSYCRRAESYDRAPWPWTDEAVAARAGGVRVGQ